MKTIRLVLVSFISVIGALVASAQQSPTTAYVSSLDGSATYLAPGATETKSVVVGQALPEGSLITTDAVSTLSIVSHEGISTTIGHSTTAAVGTHSVSADGVRTAVIDLKSGTSVSVLDPTKRATNNYAIRTPKGVAAARGTTYSTTVKLSSGGEAVVTVNTVTGAVSFSIVGANGVAGPTLSVAEGNSANSNSTVPTTIAQAMAAATGSAKADIAEALNATVAAVSIIANASTGSEGAKANNVLRSVVENVTKSANELAAKGDTAAATALVSNTVTTVRELAGTSSEQAVKTITTNATNAEVKAAATAAEAAPVTVKTVTVAPATSTTPQTISAPAPSANTTPQSTIDITTVSESSPR